MLSFFAGRTPDSPESVRAVAPRSPISPKAQYSSLALQRTANGSTSPPIQKGGSTTPPQTSSTTSIPQAATPILLTDTSKELSKLRKFLGALYQFGQDTSTECGDRVRSLILSLVVSWCQPLPLLLFFFSSFLPLKICLTSLHVRNEKRLRFIAEIYTIYVLGSTYSFFFLCKFHSIFRLWRQFIFFFLSTSFIEMHFSFVCFFFLGHAEWRIIDRGIQTSFTGIC